MKSRKIVIYARVSTEEKQDTTRQITELKKRIYGDPDNQTMDVEVISEKISGYKIQGGSLLEGLIENIENNPDQYKKIYVWELSRLGRNPMETRQRIEKILSHNVDIYVETLKTVLSKDVNSFAGNITKILLLFMLEFGHLEIQQTKMRVRSGLLQGARSGRAGGGSYIPYGYRKDADKMLVVDDNESIQIKRIFDLYTSGLGIKRISGVLNSEQIPTRSNLAHPNKTISNRYGRIKTGKDIRWSDKQIYDILRNTIYIGERRFKGEVVSSPPIIDRELFYECNTTLKTKTTKSDVKHLFLLKNLMICNCGRNYVGVNKSDEKVYKCSSRLLSQGSCGSVGVNIKFIESVIFNIALISSNLVTFVKGSEDFKRNIENEITVLISEINLFKNGLQDKRRQLEKLLSDSLSSVFTPEMINKKAKSLNNEINNLQSTLNLRIKEKKEKQEFLSSTLEDNFDILIKAKEDRGSLMRIFAQIFNEITVTSSTKDYFFIRVNVKIFEENNIIFNLRLDRSQHRKKVKKYIYSIESASLNSSNIENGSLSFNRGDYTHFKGETLIEFEEPRLFEKEVLNTDNLFQDLMVLRSPMFISECIRRYLVPIEIPQEYLTSM